MDKGRVERVRLLLEELETAFAALERKTMAAWQDSTPDDVAARENAYYDLRALRGVRRELTNVLRAEQLENPNG